MGYAVISRVVRARKEEIRVVEHVEAFRTELHVYALRNTNLLMETRVPGHKAGPNKGVPAHVADAAQARSSKEPVWAAPVGLAVLEARAPAISPLVMARVEMGRLCVGAVVALEIQVEVAARIDAVAAIDVSLRTGIARCIGYVRELADKWTPVCPRLPGDDPVNRPATQEVPHESILCLIPRQLPNIVCD